MGPADRLGGRGTAARVAGDGRVGRGREFEIRLVSIGGSMTLFSLVDGWSGASDA